MRSTLQGLLTRASVIGLFLSAVLQAGITHVNALGGPGGNTVNARTNSPTDWFVPSTGGPDATSTSSDKLWGERLTFGIGGKRIFENWGNPNYTLGDLLSPDLKTTITGLTPGATYKVWVDYIRFANDHSPERGMIEAGLIHRENMSVFGRASGDGGTVGDSVPNGFVNEDRTGFRGYLGTAVAYAAGRIDVFIGTLVQSAAEERTWYDGVSYQQVFHSGGGNHTGRDSSPVVVALSGFLYDPADGNAEITIEGTPNTAYQLFVVDDLNFINPAQKPIALKSATVGVLHTNNVTTDSRGHATIQFNLGPNHGGVLFRVATAP